ncbi:methylated-DNA--[protein]-cysteine S-methyltransferase [Garicola koreensis]|uniref:Methylated-DNA-[protein]-cysteine S-methyltransferase n=1 Tax=Garicola koreensis TaxID=1262554 RepID=A0A7W5XNE5_9MICC|nr:methylated-DNA--[protein]-cysteine S-methyltransferase [Garicola koreensis]MBB3666547.1 methylated-DNA-[protein]-cysteine S-methyltransferase [Garicola koreensis]
MSSITAASCQTPDGVFTVLSNGTHVLASGWTQDPADLMGLIHPSLRGWLQQDPVQAPQVLTDAVQAVAAYYDDDPSALDAVPVQQRSGPFRQRAWEVLREVEPGSPLTYSEYAAAAGNPAAVQAAAGACAKNAAALFVPCHRVIRTDGSLGGFRYGTDLKRSLLSREAAL